MSECPVFFCFTGNCGQFPVKLKNAPQGCAGAGRSNSWGWAEDVGIKLQILGVGSTGRRIRKIVLSVRGEIVGIKLQIMEADSMKSKSRESVLLAQPRMSGKHCKLAGADSMKSRLRETILLAGRVCCT